MKLHLFCFLLLISLTSHSQNSPSAIKGFVYDAHGQSLPFASVQLKADKSDSKPIRGAFTDEQGQFLLLHIPFGTYVLQVSMIGHLSYERELQVTEDMDLGRLILETDANMLSEVTLTARPKVVERQSDRFVVDIGASTFQTSSVMEIFMAMPFMQVQGEQISINGKRNILVLVDNVPVPGATPLKTC